MLDHHRAQLVLCDLPEPRVKCVVVRCGERESTGDALTKTIKDQKVDHVVLGTRGLGALQRRCSPRRVSAPSATSSPTTPPSP